MPFDITLEESFALILVGPSRSGKTTWVKNMLTYGDQLMRAKPEKVFLFYKMMQNMYQEMKDSNLVHKLVDVSQQMPTLDEIKEMVEPFKNNGGSMIIFDDCMSDINSDFEQLFCNLSHHMDCSIVFLTQNLFYQNNTFRTMSRNTSYMVLMKSERDKLQISMLGKQYSPHNHKFIEQAYYEATKQPYSYLFLNYCANVPNSVRVLSHIFPHEFPVRTYLESKHNG